MDKAVGQSPASLRPLARLWRRFRPIAGPRLAFSSKAASGARLAEARFAARPMERKAVPKLVMAVRPAGVIWPVEVNNGCFIA